MKHSSLLTFPKKQLWLLRLIYLFLANVPVVLLISGVIPTHWVYLSLTLTTIFIVALWVMIVQMKHYNWTWADVGFTTHIKKDLVFYGPIIALGVLCFFIAPFVVKVREITFESIVFFTILGCPMQEFLYRVCLLKIGTLIFSPTTNAVVNVILFSSMHLFYKDAATIMPTVIGAGTVFTWLYSKRPNYALITITHMVWLCVAMYVRIFA